jgi:hypothetical protein
MRSNNESISEVLHKIPNWVCNRLLNLSRVLIAQSESHQGFIKIVLMDRPAFPAVVIIEEIIHVELNSTPRDISRKLIKKIGLSQTDTQLRFFFVGRGLEKDLPIQEAGVAFGDRIYCVLEEAFPKIPIDDVNTDEKSLPYDGLDEVWNNWAKTIRQIGSTIEANPELYVELARLLERQVKQLINGKSGRRVQSSIWKCLVLLRCLAGILQKERRDVAQRALSTLTELASISWKPSNNSSEYEIRIAILELLCWIGYRFSWIILDDQGKISCVGREFTAMISRLLSENGPASLKAEAAWMLGWIGVSIPNIAKKEIDPLLRIGKINTEWTEHVHATAMLRICASLANRGQLKEASYYLLIGVENFLRGRIPAKHHEKGSLLFKYAALYHNLASHYTDVSQSVNPVHGFPVTVKNAQASEHRDIWLQESTKLRTHIRRLLVNHLLPSIVLAINAMMVALLLVYFSSGSLRYILSGSLLIAPVLLLGTYFKVWKYDRIPRNRLYSIFSIIIFASSLLLVIIFLGSNKFNFSAFYYAWLSYWLAFALLWTKTKGAIFYKESLFTLARITFVFIFGITPIMIVILLGAILKNTPLLELLQSASSVFPIHIFSTYFAFLLFFGEGFGDILPFHLTRSAYSVIKPVEEPGLFKILGGGVQLDIGNLYYLSSSLTNARWATTWDFNILIAFIEDKFSSLFLVCIPMLIGILTSCIILYPNHIFIFVIFTVAGSCLLIIIGRIITFEFHDLRKLKAVCITLVFYMPLFLVPLFLLIFPNAFSHGNAMTLTTSGVVVYLLVPVIISALYIYLCIQLPGRIAVSHLKQRIFNSIELQASAISERLVNDSIAKNEITAVLSTMILLQSKKQDVKEIKDYPLPIWINLIAIPILSQLGVIVATVLGIPIS